MNARTLIAPGRVMGPDPLSHREPSGELDRGERLAWWREARLGVFVHWCGSGLGHEISFSRGREVPAREYDAACRRLDPTAFDADALAGLAAESGAGYLVFVTKHADGFCWWPSEFTDHSVASTPAGRDIVGEVAAACGRAGLQFCCYHSIADWYHRDWPVGIDPNGQPKRTRDIDAYEAHLHRQVGELIQRYGPLGTLWFDAEWEWPWTHERGLRLYSHCRALQPDLIINDRVDISRQGSKGPSTGSVPPHIDPEWLYPELYVYFRTPRPDVDYAGDYRTAEQHPAARSDGVPGELCFTFGKRWSWSPDDSPRPWSAIEPMLQSVIDTDSNVLLNLSPAPDGSIPAWQVESLKRATRWLRERGVGRAVG